MTYVKPEVFVAGRTLSVIQSSGKDTDDISDSGMGTDYRTVPAYEADE